MTYRDDDPHCLCLGRHTGYLSIVASGNIDGAKGSELFILSYGSVRLFVELLTHPDGRSSVLGGRGGGEVSMPICRLETLEYCHDI